MSNQKNSVQPHLEAHDLGLQHDLLTMAAQLRARRQVLGMMMGTSATAFLAGCGGGDSAAGTGTTALASSSSSSASAVSSSSSSSSSSAANANSCVRYSTETQGPFPSDGSNTVGGQVSNVLVQTGVLRSDIRSSFSAFSGTAAGLPLTLTITLMNSNTNCSVVAGAAVYIWHCTGNGLYSLYDTAVQSQNYLRGVQVSDANGQVTFTTIFPGCYSGRYPHIHVEVFRNIGLATQLSNSSLVSQLALPRTECAAVYAAGGATYGNSTSNLNAIQISTDNVFSDNGTSVITAQTPTLTGSATTSYTGAVTIGVPLS